MSTAPTPAAVPESTASAKPQPGQAAFKSTLSENLHSFAQDYSTYLDFPELNAKHLHDVEEALLKSLSRLDELGALVEVTRGDTERLKRDVLPLLNERANELRKLFILVERLRAMVDAQRRTLDRMEAQIVADEEKISIVAMKKVMDVFGSMGSLFGAKKALPPPTDFKPVEISDSAAFFKKLREDLQLPPQ